MKHFVQQAAAVRDGKTPELIFVEGVRLCEEASALDVELVLYSPKALANARAAAWLERFDRRTCPVVELRESAMASLADTEKPQGLILLAQRPNSDQSALDASLPTNPRTVNQPLVVILHQMNNPANSGAMVRVAEAAGATGLIATAGSADLFSPKALRGSMGSSFRLPIWSGPTLTEALAWCAAAGIETVSTHLAATQSHTDLDWKIPRAVILGSEANGLTESEAAAADTRIRIPMRPPVESLNVATALAVVLYEAARQRGG